jgi:hypothetical protein
MRPDYFKVPSRNLSGDENKENLYSGQLGGELSFELGSSRIQNYNAVVTPCSILSKTSF